MSDKLRKVYNSWTVLLLIAVLMVVYLTILVPWMNQWGVTDAEAKMVLPGDSVEPGTVTTSTRGVTIHAPASQVWKWVVQLGQERAGFYSNDWLENLTLADIHNASEIRAEWQSRKLGDLVLGAGGMIYQTSSGWHILAYEEGKATFLWGPIVVLPVNAQTSRLLARTSAKPGSMPMQIISLLTFDWMHFVMERGMLLGIQERAEGTLDSNLIARGLSAIGWIAATISIALVLFARRRGWWWGLIPLVYALAIIGVTRDLWSAMAGFLWWGIIAAGFVLYGHKWWQGLALATALVILIFVVVPQPHIAFGMIFLIVVAAVAAWTINRKKIKEQGS